MSSFLQLLLNLCLLMTAAKIGGWIAIQLRPPAVLEELLAGLLLGPSLLHELEWAISSKPANPHLSAETIFRLVERRCLPDVSGRLRNCSPQVATIRQSSGAGRDQGDVFLPGVEQRAGLVRRLCRYGWFFIDVVLRVTNVSLSVQTWLELEMLRSREKPTLYRSAKTLS